jgi:non-ribosomal peptide synthase protein (TIGR01720 family)
MNELQQRINSLSPEKRRLFERLLGAESNTAWSRAPYQAPRNEVEEKLVLIWSEVLGVGAVGIHDNYFELGGDSIQCIQVMSKARRAGIRINSELLFQHPTVAELAVVAGVGAPTETQDQVFSTCAPLTPVQRWFLTLEVTDRNHWNQAMILETAPGVTFTMIGEGLQKILNTHDALRLRFRETSAGWEQEVVPIENLSIEVVRLTEGAARSLSDVVREVAERVQRSLNIHDGPVMAAAFFDCGSLPGRLLLVCHHLVADTVSFRIIAEDLERLLRASSQSVPQTPSVEHGSSWIRWCHALAKHAESDTVRAEQSYWAAHAQEPQPLPVDYPGGSNSEADARVHSVALSREETVAFFQRAIAALRADATEILLTATTRALMNWTRRHSITVDLEGHGREPIEDTIDLSHTVGWFTIIYPIRIVGVHSDWRGALRAVKETFRQTPRRGFGYGLLRYVLGDSPVMKSHSPVAINYLGRFDRVLPAGSLLRVAREHYGQLYDPRGRRPYVLQVVSMVLEDRMETNWIYSERLHTRATVEAVAKEYIETLRAMIAEAESSEGDVLTPADFPDADLSPLDLERLLKG